MKTKADSAITRKLSMLRTAANLFIMITASVVSVEASARYAVGDTEERTISVQTSPTTYTCRLWDNAERTSGIGMQVPSPGTDSGWCFRTSPDGWLLNGPRPGQVLEAEAKGGGYSTLRATYKVTSTSNSTDTSACAAPLVGDIIHTYQHVTWERVSGNSQVSQPGTGPFFLSSDESNCRPPNTPPTVDELSLSTPESTTLQHTLVAQDIDSSPPFVFELVGNYNVDPEDDLGVIEIIGNQLVFTPFSYVNGTTRFMYRAQDDHGAWSTPKQITITIVGQNNPPTATGAHIFTRESQTSEPVLPWVIDPDIPYGDTHTFAINTAPAHGSAFVQDGSLVYQPHYQFVGEDSFTILAIDSEGEVVEGEVAVQVEPFNYPPTDILPSEIVMLSGVGGTEIISITDPNLWDSHTLIVTSQPAQGLVTVEGMTISYWTDSEEDAVFRLKAVDSGGLSVEKDIRIKMRDVMDLLEGRPVTDIKTISLPAIDADLYNSRGAYPLVITEPTALEEIGDEIILFNSAESEVGVRVMGRTLLPGKAMRLSPHILTDERLEASLATAESGVDRSAELFIFNVDPSREAYRVPVDFWTLHGELSSSNGWEILQATELTRITLNTSSRGCNTSTSKPAVQRRNLLDDPTCYVKWETMPSESRNITLMQSLVMEVAGSTPGSANAVARAYVYDNEGNEHSIGTFEQELTILPINGLMGATLQPDISEVYQSVQELSLVLRSDHTDHTGRSCDVTSNEENAKRLASNWSGRPTCFIEWTSVPPGLKEPVNWGIPELRGTVTTLGTNVISWNVSVFTPSGEKILVNEQSHDFKAVMPPPIEIELPDLQSRLSERMYGVPTTGGYIGAASIYSIPADLSLKSERGGVVLRDDIQVNYGRSVISSMQVEGDERPLWSVTPFTIEAAYALLPEIGTTVKLELLATPPPTVLPFILNDERMVNDSDDFIVSTKILDQYDMDSGYSNYRHGDWDIRLVQGMPGGSFEPLTEWKGVDGGGVSSFALDLSDMANAQLRVYAEARSRSPIPDYESIRRSNSPLTISVLNGSPVDAEVQVMRLFGVAPFRNTFTVKSIERAEARDIGNITWEISNDSGATWEVQSTGALAQRLSHIFPEGVFHVRAHIENRHSGAMSVTPTVEVHAFTVPDARLHGPQNIFVGAEATYTLVDRDGNPIDPSELDIQWSSDRGDTWVDGNETLTIQSDKAERIHLQAKLKMKTAPDHRLAYKDVRMGVSFRQIRPPRVQIIGPRRPEVGKEATWTANMMMPYQGMSLEMDGFFILPDGTEVDSKETQYTPSQDDYDRERSYIRFDGWIEGYEDIGGRGLTEHRLTFWSYDWPTWRFNVSHNAIHAPADVNVNLRNLGAFREFESLQVEWVMPDDEGIEITRDTGTMGRSFTVHEPGIYTLGAHISDSRGHYSYVELDLEYGTPPDWMVDLSWSGNNDFNREPLNVLIRPSLSGGHRRDRVEERTYFVNGQPLEGTGNYGRAILNSGNYEVTMQVKTSMGHMASGVTSIEVVKNKVPACELDVIETRSSWRATADCQDEDGRVSSYRWWIDGEEQALKSRIISIPQHRYPDGEPIITLVGVDDSGDESPPVSQK